MAEYPGRQHRVSTAHGVRPSARADGEDASASTDGPNQEAGEVGDQRDAGRGSREGDRGREPEKDEDREHCGTSMNEASPVESRFDATR